MRVMFICMNDTVSRSCKILYSHLDQVFSCTTPVCKALCKTHCEGLLDIVYTCFRYTPVCQKVCPGALRYYTHTHLFQVFLNTCMFSAVLRCCVILYPHMFRCCYMMSDAVSRWREILYIEVYIPIFIYIQPLLCLRDSRD